MDAFFSELFVFILNIAFIVLIVVVGIKLIIVLPKIVYIAESWIKAMVPLGGLLVWGIRIGSILLIFFNINESHSFMWIGIILTLSHLIDYTIVPKINPRIREIIYKNKLKRKKDITT